MSDQPNNPFIKAYDAVYNLLFEGVDNPLPKLVKIGNRLSYGSEINKDRNPAKTAVSSADLPEVMLYDEGGSTNLHANSSGCEFRQSLTIICSTGDYRYGVICSCVNWWILCNLAQWRSRELTTTTWKGLATVKTIDIIPVQIGESNPERNRMIDGWTTIWRMQLVHRIPNVNLTYYEN